MTVEVEFEVPTDAPGERSWISLPDGVRASLEAAVPLTRDAMLPFVWVRDDGGDFAAVEEAFRGHPAVRDVRLVDQDTTEALFQLEWQAGGRSVIDLIRETDGTLLEGSLADGRWTFLVRFPGSDAVSRFQSRCNGLDVALRVNRVSKQASRDGSFYDALTPGQREALVAAHQLGYFTIPRRASLVDIADRLGITDQAASERIRRAINRLLSRLPPSAD